MYMSVYRNIIKKKTRYINYFRTQIKKRQLKLVLGYGVRSCALTDTAQLTFVRFSFVFI